MELQISASSAHGETRRNEHFHFVFRAGAIMVDQRGFRTYPNKEYDRNFPRRPWGRHIQYPQNEVETKSFLSCGRLLCPRHSSSIVRRAKARIHLSRALLQSGSLSYYTVPLAKLALMPTSQSGLTGTAVGTAAKAPWNLCAFWKRPLYELWAPSRLRESRRNRSHAILALCQLYLPETFWQR